MSAVGYVLWKLDRLERRITKLEEDVMAFQDDLDAIAARIQKASDDAAVAKTEADNAATADVAQDTKIDAATTMAQTALDEIAALVQTLKGNPPPPTP